MTVTCKILFYSFCLVFVSVVLFCYCYCCYYYLAKEPELRGDLIKYAADDNQTFQMEMDNYDRNIQLAGHVSLSAVCF